MKSILSTVLSLVAALLLSACASTEPANDPANQPPSGATLAEKVWWDGLEGEDVYIWTSSQTMPMPVGGMKAIVDRARNRIGGLDCLKNHERFSIAALVSAEGNLVDTRILGNPKNDACENLVRLAAFDLEWKPGSVNGGPVHASFQFGFQTSFLR